MESIPKHKILSFHSDTLVTVRQTYDLDKPGKMNEAIDLLEEWVKKQNHFIKKDFPRGYLERTLISCKGSVERAKTRIDKVCTLRTLMPHLFGDYNIKTDFTFINNTNFVQALLPNLTKDNYRVFFIKSMGNYDSRIFIQLYRLYIIIYEHLRAHDYSTGLIYVVDFTELNVLAYATGINPVELHQVVNLVVEGYGVRIKGIHLITKSKVVDVLVTLFKQVVSAKVGERIFVHKTIESVHEVLPREILPKEYGGEEKSITSLHDEWIDLLSSEEHANYQREMNRARTNEANREKDTSKDEYLGIQGSFRTLNVD